MSSPTPGGGFGSALGGLEDSGVDWHLLSPALHAQRAANIAGRKHGGAFSRKVVEEMVEKMEKKTAVEQAKGGPVCLYPFARPFLLSKQKVALCVYILLHAHFYVLLTRCQEMMTTPAR